MIHKNPIVNPNQVLPIINSPTQSNKELGPRNFPIVMLQRTSDSCACANERAQSRRYEAVCEIHPRQNSMV